MFILDILFILVDRIRYLLAINYQDSSTKLYFIQN